MPHLVSAGAGHVVNIASLAGLAALPFGGVYCASKHAVVASSEMLRAELAAMGLPIGVTVACPALVRTAQADDDTLAGHLPANLSVEQLRAQLKHMIAAPWSRRSRPSASLPRSKPIGCTR